MTSYYRDDLLGLPEMGVVARQLWETSGLGPGTCRPPSSTTTSPPTCSTSSRSSGSARKGEAKDFVRDGRIELGGALPINTHGGQLGEAYLHGMNGIAEGVRLVRGTSVTRCPTRARGGDGRHRRADQRAGPRRRSLRLTRPRRPLPIRAAGGRGVLRLTAARQVGGEPRGVDLDRADAAGVPGRRVQLLPEKWLQCGQKLTGGPGRQVR